MIVREVLDYSRWLRAIDIVLPLHKFSPRRKFVQRPSRQVSTDIDVSLLIVSHQTRWPDRRSIYTRARAQRKGVVVGPPLCLFPLWQQFP
eukprot:m.400590 g.400590  ORF g.400590 m.400590 type:complete len:90 (-) comp21160_c0_seq1:1282-1551(-)